MLPKRFCTFISTIELFQIIILHRSSIRSFKHKESFRMDKPFLKVKAYGGDEWGIIEETPDRRVRLQSSKHLLWKFSNNWECLEKRLVKTNVKTYVHYIANSWKAQKRRTFSIEDMYGTSTKKTQSFIIVIYHQSTGTKIFFLTFLFFRARLNGTCIVKSSSLCTLINYYFPIIN